VELIMVFLSVSVAWMVLPLDVSVEIRTVRIGKPEGKRVAGPGRGWPLLFACGRERDRWSSFGQRFALRSSAADCPPEDSRSLSLERVFWSRTPPARAGGGFGGVVGVTFLPKPSRRPPPSCKRGGRNPVASAIVTLLWTNVSMGIPLARRTGDPIFDFASWAVSRGCGGRVPLPRRGSTVGDAPDA
jgi:hypothetical protein